MKAKTDYLTLSMLMLSGMLVAAIGSRDLAAYVPGLLWALLPVINVGVGIGLNQMKALGAEAPAAPVQGPHPNG